MKFYEFSSKIDEKNTHFHLLDAECALPAKQFDFVYFFDVLVHVDVHTQFRYYAQLPKVTESVLALASSIRVRRCRKHVNFGSVCFGC